MSNEATNAVENAQGSDKKKKKLWLLLLPLLLLLLLGIGFCAKSTVSPGELERRLKADGTDIIEINGDVKIDEPLVINGDKTITGNGRIILKGELAGEWPKGNKKASSWGAGCTVLDLEDTDKMSAILNVSDGATLTMEGSAKVDANKNGNGIHVKDGGTLIVKGKATIENGRYANIVISEKATATIEGGNVNNAEVHGVVNKGKLDITGGTLSGAAAGAVVYNTGTATQSGGTIEKAGVHNVYVDAGSFTMTGGKNDSATKDGLSVQKGAKAEITGGDITNSVHGLCNDGEMSVGKITLNTCGIMNYKNGILNIDGTTVENAGTYSLGNNGGKVVAKNFTAKKGNSCAIYNFSGDMELINVTTQGIREANITNGGGNMTVKGADLQKCNDKSIVVGNGVAVFEDIKIGGTKREKYGCYVYGGELYINNAEMKEIDSTAFKVDMGGIIEVKNATVKGVGDIGMRSDGGKMTLENVSIEDIKSHGIYNMNGEINVKNVTLKNIGKNAIQNRGGNTNADGLYAENIANHAAYIAIGNVKVSNSTFKNMEGNGFYLVEGENEATLNNVTIDGVQKQGVNNNSKLTIDGLKVRNGQQNGIFNKANGTVKAKNVDISDVAEHGINNYNIMTLTDSKISNTGKGSNNLQNKGTLTIEDVECLNSKNHGVYNTGTIKGSELEIKKAAKNGVYNNKGTFTVDKITVDGAGEHGLNNAATMTVSNVTVKNTGDGKNNIQNAGTLSISTATLSASKNHGIYNKGTISGKDVTVEGSKGNGVYNDGGTIDAIDGLTVKNVGDQGINNTSKLVVSNVTINGTAKNGVYNKSGNATINGIAVSGTGEHGVSNAGTMALTNANITGSGEGSNGIQNAGVLTVNKAVVKDTKNHGIYNKATISGKNVTVENTKGNGVYNDGGTVDAIAGLTVKNAGDQGINNKGSFVASSVDIIGTAKNGIYNNGGTANINGIIVTGTGEHGVNNAGTMTLANADIDGSGKGSNGIQNKGTLTVSATVSIKNSSNHGIYNDNVVNATGTIKVFNSAANAVYNYNGDFTAEKVEADTTVQHGINNAGTMTLGSVEVQNAGENGIQNSKDLTITGSAILKDSAKHGIYNGKVLDAKNITIENAGDNMINNGGELVVDGLVITGTANKAIYNASYAELYKVTVEGKDIINKKNGAPQTRDQQRLVDNNGGVLDLTDATIKDAYAIAMANRGKARTSVTNVVIDKAGDYGVYVEGSAKVSGDGLEINGVIKGAEITGAEGMPIKVAGKLTMLDHVTIGEDDPTITGSGVATSGEFIATQNNAIVMDAASSMYSGYDLRVVNATGGNGIYNKGIVYLKGFDVDTANYGMACRYTGWAYLSGDVTIKNVKTNGVRTFGKDDGSQYSNGISLASGTNFTVDGAGGHGVNNKGSFLAAADSNVTIKNIKGNNVNAINNNTGTMTLGNVLVDGVYVNVTGTNTNSGNGLQTNNAVTLDGAAVIKNIYTNGHNDNSNSTAVVVKNSGSTQGSLKGKGSITVIGNDTVAPDGVEYDTGVYNGILTSKCPIELEGDINVDNTLNQGIYVADANGSVKAKNVTVKNVENGHGVYVNNATGKFTATGNYVADNIHRGLYSNTGGEIAISGNATITNPKNVGIEVNGKITVLGDVSVDMNNLNKYGIYLNAGTMKARKVDVKNTATTTIYMENSSSLEAVDLTIENSTNQGLQVQKKGTLKITGTMTVKNVDQNALRIYNDARNKPSITINKLVAIDAGNYAVAANYTIANTNLSITTLQHKNCVNLVHTNVQAGCIGTIQEITE